MLMGGRVRVACIGPRRQRCDLDQRAIAGRRVRPEHVADQRFVVPVKAPRVFEFVCPDALIGRDGRNVRFERREFRVERTERSQVGGTSGS
jgi:hypothetical protein